MALTSAELERLTPPTGWKFRVGTTIRTAGVITRDPGQAWNKKSYKGFIQALWKWAVQNDLGLVPDNGAYVYMDFAYSDAYVTTEYFVKANQPELTTALFGDGTYTCPGGCGERVEIGTLGCRNCGIHRCQACDKSGMPLYKSHGAGRTWVLCGLCSKRCSNHAQCGGRIYTAAEEGDKCAVCDPKERCWNCGKYHSTADTTRVKITSSAGVLKEVIVCKSCERRNSCQECSRFIKSADGSALKMYAGKKMCKTCHHKQIDKVREIHEKFDSTELPKHGSLVIPSLPERPFRTVSIETEVNGDKDYLATTLYNCGIVRVPKVESYGSYPDLNSAWMSFLKHDGSVTGGELISWLMNLDDDAQASAFLDVLAKLRSLKVLDKIDFKENCGGHIHIDAHNFDYGNVWRLLTVWNYLEDPIYRIAGAGHDYGHRTQVPGHDRANGGGGYARSPVKGPFGSKGAVGDSIYRQNRMCGLNFKPYLDAINACQCRAWAYGDGRNCKCDLGKCTIEWRVWNSQSNPRIIHAWIAFMQAMHAYADVAKEPDAEWENQFPAHAWPTKAWDKLTISAQNTTKERLKWMFQNLVLTDDEKDSMIYTIKQTDMKAIGNTFIESLGELPFTGEREKREKPRNPRRRTCSIVVKTPEPDADPFVNIPQRERERLLWR